MISLCILLKVINGTRIPDSIISYSYPLTIKHHPKLQQCSKQQLMLQHMAAVGIWMCKVKLFLCTPWRHIGDWRFSSTCT